MKVVSVHRCQLLNRGPSGGDGIFSSIPSPGVHGQVHIGADGHVSGDEGDGIPVNLPEIVLAAMEG